MRSWSAIPPCTISSWGFRFASWGWRLMSPLKARPWISPLAEAGLDLAPGAFLHLLPNLAGFVGADHLAMLLGSGMLEREGILLGMDIGTNTEISLIAHGRHYACSTASGPAFEGAHIRHGMRAAPGAIEKVLIRGEEVQAANDRGSGARRVVRLRHPGPGGPAAPGRDPHPARRVRSRLRTSAPAQGSARGGVRRVAGGGGPGRGDHLRPEGCQ